MTVDISIFLHQDTPRHRLSILQNRSPPTHQQTSHKAQLYMLYTFQVPCFHTSVKFTLNFFCTLLYEQNCMFVQTLKPLTGDMNNIDHLVTMQCPAGKCWVPSSMRMPYDTTNYTPSGSVYIVLFVCASSASLGWWIMSSGSHLNARTPNFSAEHCIVKG